MSQQPPIEVIQPNSYTSNPGQQNTNTVWKVIAVVLVVLVLCCCCSFLLIFAGLWGAFGWLWNNGDALLQIGSLVPLFI